MRKETEKIARAFIERRPKRGARSHTDGENFYLHNILIAWWDHDRSLSLCMRGYATMTTRDRLNGVCELAGYGRPFHQKKGEQYFNDRRIDPCSTITLHSIEPSHQPIPEKVT